METVTLHSQDFKTVHNTLCELRDLQRMVVEQPLGDLLLKIVRQFEQGLENAYKQDEAAFDTKMDHYSDIKQQLGLRSIWSIFEVEDLNQQHPYAAAVEVCYRDHWGEQPVYEMIPGPTWLDLYRAADRCIQRSGDAHHIFIEHFATVADQPHQIRLTTGS